MCTQMRNRQQKNHAFLRGQINYGGDDGDRTHYLMNAIHALSQVSYIPESVDKILANIK